MGQPNSCYPRLCVNATRRWENRRYRRMLPAPAQSHSVLPYSCAHSAGYFSVATDVTSSAACSASAFESDRISIATTVDRFG
jgi:hypothetical protein